MILLGNVSSIESGYRVTFPDKENIVSPPLQTASHVGTLEVGENVVVVFTSNNIASGVIIGKI